MIGTKKKTKKANVFKEIADNFEQLTKNPERFLKPQPEQISAIEQLIQQTYSVSISGDVENKKDLLPELVLEQMDEEQIWQQLEMRNELVFPQLLEKTAKLMAMKEKHLGIELDDDEEDEQLAAESDEDEPAQEAPDSDFDVSGSDAEDLPKKSKPKSVSQSKKSGKRVRSSVVDDTFFKLDEMKEFLEQEDAKEMRKQNSKNRVEEDADAIDYYADDFGVGEEEDEDDVNVNYADFFEVDEELEREAQKLNKQSKGKQRDYFNENEAEAEEEEEEEVVPEEEDEDENEEANDDQEDAPSEIDESEFVAKSGIEPASDSDSSSDKEVNDMEEEDDDDQEEATPAVQSSNELREARLFQRIRDYEDIVLGEKPWQLKGEVQAANRPQNSLLEEILDFESTTRPTAPLTEEDNRSIEDIIMQRIRDKAWDDVVRTVRVDNTPQEYRKQLVLDQEKSKQSLAQIYEKQYQQELEKLDPNKDADDNAGPEPKEHQEIKRMMRSLFLKLDALSNFHFTPKPVAPEVKIVTNTPAVHMEEVAPLAVSDAKLLAPEEVFRGPKHAPLGKTERTRTDKNRERRKKKQKQRAINAVLETRDLQRAKEGKAPTKREADAKLLKTITKSRNVQKITASTNDQGALKSSKAFFNKLQDTTATAASGAGSKRPKKDPAKANAKKLKL
ncbi:U3 small nucleolar ribonucleoprotein protein MPP10 [Drosophila subobscura]|uniref:U3 small nucleolar ribonucleoprotein protein MPP10 n=1 Tax=Drosophila subobscura TaxID=7241 RepID=UPI00155B154B|nr:U3 small nucleolar ribonucleoprotein protein MPP10 [Drosophila subobscura]